MSIMLAKASAAWMEPVVGRWSLVVGMARSDRLRLRATTAASASGSRTGTAAVRHEAQLEPAEDVIHDRLGEADVGCSTIRWARSGCAELFAEHLERHAVLQRDGEARGSYP